MANLGGVNERAHHVERIFATPVLIAAILVLPTIIVEESNLGGRWHTTAAVVNWIIWIVFAAELAATTQAADQRKRWLREHVLEVVIVTATVPFYPSSLQAARVLRLARVFRLLRLAKIARRTFSADGVRYAAVAALLTILGGGAAYASVENNGMSTWDGVWWAITTMTTVGYGGTPTTDYGRVITIIVLFVGIGFVAFFTGAIAERFIRGDVRVVEETLTDVGTTELEMVHELREIRERLQALEERLAGRGQARTSET